MPSSTPPGPYKVLDDWPEEGYTPPTLIPGGTRRVRQPLSQHDYVDPQSPTAQGTGRGTCRIKNYQDVTAGANANSTGLCDYHRAKVSRMRTSRKPKPVAAPIEMAEPKQVPEPEEHDTTESAGYTDPGAPDHFAEGWHERGRLSHEDSESMPGADICTNCNAKMPHGHPTTYLVQATPAADGETGGVTHVAGPVDLQCSELPLHAQRSVKAYSNVGSRGMRVQHRELHPPGQRPEPEAYPSRPMDPNRGTRIKDLRQPRAPLPGSDAPFTGADVPEAPEIEPWTGAETRESAAYVNPVQVREQDTEPPEETPLPATAWPPPPRSSKPLMPQGWSQSRLPSSMPPIRRTGALGGGRIAPPLPPAPPDAQPLPPAPPHVPTAMEIRATAAREKAKVATRAARAARRKKANLKKLDDELAAELDQEPAVRSVEEVAMTPDDYIDPFAPVPQPSDPTPLTAYLDPAMGRPIREDDDGGGDGGGGGGDDGEGDEGGDDDGGADDGDGDDDDDDDDDDGPGGHGWGGWGWWPGFGYRRGHPDRRHGRDRRGRGERQAAR